MRYRHVLKCIDKKALYKLGMCKDTYFPKLSFLKKKIYNYKFSYYNCKNSIRVIKCVNCGNNEKIDYLNYYRCSKCDYISKPISNKARTLKYYKTYNDIIFQDKILKYSIFSCSDGEVTIRLVGIAFTDVTYARFTVSMNYNCEEYDNLGMKWRIPGKRSKTYTFFYDYNDFILYSALNKRQRKLIISSTDLHDYTDYLKILDELNIRKSEKWLYNIKYRKLHVYLSRINTSLKSKKLGARYEKAVKNVISYKNLKLIRKYNELLSLAKEFSNCVGSYASKVINKECIIYRYSDNDVAATIEVKNNTVVQAQSLNHKCIKSYLKEKYKTLDIRKWK